MYHIGKIVNTHGIKGEVKIYNLSDFNRFFVGKTIFYELKNEYIPLKIKTTRKQNNLLIVKFEEYNNINDILFLKGLEVYSKEDPRGDLEEDEFHYHDLVDKKAFDQNDNLIGVIINVIEVPQGHLLELKQTNNKTTLIPFRKPFIGDITEDKIVINVIEGLL